jgi:hypothetical protein
LSGTLAARRIPSAIGRFVTAIVALLHGEAIIFL